MTPDTVRLLERIGGGLLIVVGLAWLIFGLMSLEDASFFLRGLTVVAVISFALMVAGALLAKRQTSTSGRIFAAVICAFGAIREMSFAGHETAVLHDLGWIGAGLLALYVLLLALITANHFRQRRRSASS
jgi:hypothetical protein